MATENKNSSYVLAYDLGGTKAAAGIVNRQGEVIDENREIVDFSLGPEGVIDQLEKLAKPLLSKHSDLFGIGIASAGPLDPATGVLLDPTNMFSKGRSWGQVPIAKLLEEKLKLPTVLENDAAAAVLAEHWVGAAKDVKNAIVLTLGTGVGVGVICNGQLARAGRGLHPEASHIIINADDETAHCGCRNHGCIEAYLSARNFSRRASARFSNPQLDGKALAELGRKKHPRALEAFDEYAYYMAIAIQNFVVLWAPETIIFTGSFAEAADLFIDSTKERLAELVGRRRVGIDLLPNLTVSTLQNQASVIGAAYVAFHRKSS